MGFRVLVEEHEGRRCWDSHPHAVRWKVFDGALVLFYPASHRAVIYESHEWVKVEDLK